MSENTWIYKCQACHFEGKREFFDDFYDEQDDKIIPECPKCKIGKVSINPYPYGRKY